jgi:hypothetical protein
LDDYITSAKKRNDELKRTQPYIVSIGRHFYIMCDDRPVDVTPSKFSKALLDLIATFFVFNVNYPDQLKAFYQFLEVLLLGSNRSLPPKSTTLLKSITTC